MDRVRSNFDNNANRIWQSLLFNNGKLRGLLDPSSRFESIQSTRKGTTMAKVFENIRHHASSLHKALQKGWNCDCYGSHPGGLRLQKRTTGAWSSQLNVAVVVPAESLHVFREVMVSIKGTGPAEGDSRATNSQSSPDRGSRLDNPNPTSESRLSAQPSEISHTGSSPLRRSFLQSHFGTWLGSPRKSEMVRNSTSLSSTTETECLEYDGRSRYCRQYHYND